MEMLVLAIILMVGAGAIVVLWWSGRGGSR